MKLKGKKTAPVRYVIFQPAADDFLGKVEETDDVILYGWTPHPADALKYETFGKAEGIALDIVANKEHTYRLEICELHQSDEQLGVRPVAVVAPKAARHNPDSN